jgi:hypothetical protein
MIPLDENKVLDIRTMQRDRASKNAHPYRSMSELIVEPPAKKSLIKGVIARGENSAWVAPPGGMKSALMAELTICVASGTDWHGFKNKETAGVLYFALERADLVRRRLLAHGERLGRMDLPIFLSSAVVNLSRTESVDMIVATIDQIEQENDNISIGLLIFDTFAKLIAAFGGDENTAKDHGKVFANIERIKNRKNVHVAFVAHTGKDETKGMRGSSAAPGDVDILVEIRGDGIKTANVTKANDRPEGPLFSYKAEVHSFGEDDDGDPISVNIISPEAVEIGAGGSDKVRLTPNQQTFYRILYDAADAGLTVEEWNRQAREVGIGVSRKADLVDLRKALQDKCVIRESGGRWRVAHT